MFLKKNLLGSKIYQCNLKFDFLNNTFSKGLLKLKKCIDSPSRGKSMWLVISV